MFWVCCLAVLLLRCYLLTFVVLGRCWSFNLGWFDDCVIIVFSFDSFFCGITLLALVCSCYLAWWFGVWWFLLTLWFGLN